MRDGNEAIEEEEEVKLADIEAALYDDVIMQKEGENN